MFPLPVRLFCGTLFSCFDWTASSVDGILLHVFNAAQTNARKRFNLNAKVVLKACSNVAMVAHSWKPKSDAAMAAAEIAPPSSDGKLPQPVVTVTLRAAMASPATYSEPYTFEVTATLDETYAGNQINALTSLRLNNVRYLLLICTQDRVLCFTLLLFISLIICTVCKS